MSKIVLFIVTALTLLGCVQSTTSNDNNINVKEASGSTLPSRLFTLSDAEKIMGEPAHLKDSSSTSKDNYFQHSSSFEANAKDSATDKLGVIYFMFEQYGDVVSAQKVYTDIKKSNEKNGIETVERLGDEAYFHTDNENFLFILVRKETKMIRMKVNKITSNTSKDQFMLVAKNITAAM
jgi:hypothetical protein